MSAQMTLAASYWPSLSYLVVSMNRSQHGSVSVFSVETSAPLRAVFQVVADFGSLISDEYGAYLS